MGEHQKSKTAEREEATLAFWKKKDIFRKTLEKPSPQGEFIFYEGPPTANGHPAIHHLESRAFKDLITRYKTMRGYHVRRKAGWDTHGLPVELEVEKELGLKNKKEIESYGIEKFNQKCKESVLRYIDEWKAFTDRIGFWVDHESTYFTFDNNYIESVWHILKHVHERGLLYKDYRVVPWCTRCGTPLSSHEVAEGYKEVTDTSIYVLFKLKDKDEYVAAWTTTPWTLPGNVALAVGSGIVYARIEVSGKQIWLAHDRASVLFPEAEITEEKSGTDLARWAYEPLLPYMEVNAPEQEKEKLNNAFKIYAADFVTTESGTGVVHIAPMYGADDFELGTTHNLPKLHLVNEEGKFIDVATELAGMFVKKADKKIIEMLGDKILRTEEVTHSYPHCWRCKTPLIYYARDSWYIKMSALRDELISENQKIHWEPEHIRDGRFGEWLKEVKDWAISRNRYWGTPLPLWRSASGKTLVIGSLKELAEKTKRSGNRYFVMRHGECAYNTKGILDSNRSDDNDLTPTGVEQVQTSAERLKATPPSVIYASPFKRTQQTALHVARVLGLPETSIIYDDRLQEFQLGNFNGKQVSELLAWRAAHRFDDTLPRGESYQDAKNRFGNFLHDIDKKHTGETILIVTHGIGCESLYVSAMGMSAEASRQYIGKAGPAPAEYYELDFAPLPANEKYELDVHRPYIDVVTLEHDGETYERVPEVLDVWFDSGAMPFAQDHYPFDFAEGKPFENKELLYPADFIAEAIDQTRGWFYTLHAIGVLMGKGAAYKNVICLGHLLDEKGKKMSKSFGNVVDPWDVLPEYGADALRYFMYTVNEPGESKNFDEKLVDEIIKKHMNRLLNVLSFYELFKNSARHEASRESSHILDRWIVARLDALVRTVTKNLDAYKIDKAVRPFADFIDDLSTWYLRRSRDRIKGDDEGDKKAALGTLRHVLSELSKVMAPCMPFLSEHIYRAVSKKEESVHLENWPEESGGGEQEELLATMQKARDIVSLGLEARMSAGIKVRQPLQFLSIKEKFDTEMRALICEELNVKKVVHDETQIDSIILDTTISEELKREGETREILRAVQELRKKKGLKPGERAALVIGTSVEGRTRVEEAKKELMKTASLSTIEYDSAGGDSLVFDEYEVRLKLK